MAVTSKLRLAFGVRPTILRPTLLRRHHLRHQHPINTLTAKRQGHQYIGKSTHRQPSAASRQRLPRKGLYSHDLYTQRSAMAYILMAEADSGYPERDENDVHHYIVPQEPDGLGSRSGTSRRRIEPSCCQPQCSRAGRRCERRHRDNWRGARRRQLRVELLKQQ